MTRGPARRLASVALSSTHPTVHLGERLRALRASREWSIEAAAAKAGLSGNTLSNLERTALPNPTLSTLLALMEIYDLGSIDDLFGPAPSRLLLAEWVAIGRPGTRSSA
jgi:transcriptional regulator with XRE-family HTH domain